MLRWEWCRGALVVVVLGLGLSGAATARPPQMVCPGSCVSAPPWSVAVAASDDPVTDSTADVDADHTSDPDGAAVQVGALGTWSPDGACLDGSAARTTDLAAPKLRLAYLTPFV